MNENSGGLEGQYDEAQAKELADALQRYVKERLPETGAVMHELGLTSLDVENSTSHVWFEMFKRNYKVLFANIGPEKVEQIFLSAGSWLEMLNAFGLYDFDMDNGDGENENQNEEN